MWVNARWIENSAMGAKPVVEGCRVAESSGGQVPSLFGLRRTSWHRSWSLESWRISGD